MKLILLNTGIAANFGLPQRDCEFDEATKVTDALGWSPQDSIAHVNAAINAGAYKRDDEFLSLSTRATTSTMGTKGFNNSTTATHLNELVATPTRHAVKEN